MLFAGILFFFIFPFGIQASDMRLAGELFEEGDWTACVAECRRLEASGTSHPEAFRLRAQAVKRQGGSGQPNAWWKRLGALPIKGLVAFYRTAIGPAIGSRCVLAPSCSRYSLEAARERGWLSIPMTGDRLIREPSVVMEGARPVTDAQGRIRYADPVSDHVGWKNREAGRGKE